jgi:NADPH-dependent 2,4-dienoyl-CoA reductase/sulfur reductase-like enzyme
VDLERLTTEWPNVYAGGDCSAVPISKAGGQAHLHGEVISHNLVAELDVHDGRLQARRYKPHSI